MSTIDRVVKNTWILYVRMALTVFISLYTTRLTLSALGASDFGLFNLVGGIIAMLTFLNASMASASQRFMSHAEGAGNKTKQKEIFNVSTVLHSYIAILVLIVLEIVGYFLFDKVLTIPSGRYETAKMILQFMIISTIFSIISVPYDAVINAQENMWFYAILSIIEVIFKLCIAIFIEITSNDKLLMYGLLTALLSILLFIIRRVYCHQKYEVCEVNFKKYYNKSIFSEMFSFAGWSFIGTTSSILANYGQGILLNVFFGPILNTAQAIASQVGGQLGAFALNMLKAVNPIIAKSEGAGNRSLMINASSYSAKFAFFLLMFFVVPIFIEMPFIFKIWLKVVPEYAIIFCRLLLVRMLIEQLYIPLSVAISAVGNIKKYQFYSSIINLIPLLSAFILFKLGFSPVSLYVIYIVYSFANFILTLYFAKINYNLSIYFYLTEIVGPSILVLLIVTSISWISLTLVGESYLQLFYVMITTLVISFLAIWYMGLNFLERSNIESLLKKSYLKMRNLNKM